jgi:hypothetical protein
METVQLLLGHSEPYASEFNIIFANHFKRSGPVARFSCSFIEHCASACVISAHLGSSTLCHGFVAQIGPAAAKLGRR